MSSAAGDSSLCILIPVFNDWTAASLLIAELDRALASRGLRAHLLAVNDGSTDPIVRLVPAEPAGLASLEVLDLRKNLGHQRAICVGLVYLHQAHPELPVVVLDADGEDAPGDVVTLLDHFERNGRRSAIFAARTKRAEGPLFQFFYFLYQVLHWILVGFSTRMGNFSVLPPRVVESLVLVPEMWNHYAACVVKARQPFLTVPVARAKRLEGRSKLGFTGLAIHGLSAISVYGESVAVRMIVIATLAAIAAAVALAFGNAPAWLWVATGAVSILALLTVLTFTLLTLSSRAHPAFIPLRDAPIHIRGLETQYRR
ncbi:MAG: glycosyltransferase [Bryobacteraceae bacterium]